MYDKNLEENDLVVMVTDGILEASSSYDNKEEWISELLEAINPENPQRLADVILQEAVDNGFGIANDDMTVVVAKVIER